MPCSGPPSIAGANGHGAGWLAAVPAATGLVLALVVGLQIGALHYSPSRYIPTASDRVAGDHFIALVRRTPGPVIVADHPYYETLAGKASWAQGESVHDILRAGPSLARTDLLYSIDTLLRSEQPVTVFADGPSSALGPFSVPYFRLTSTKVLRLRALLLPRNGSQTTSGLPLCPPLTPLSLVKLSEPATRILPAVGQAEVCRPGDPRRRRMRSRWPSRTKESPFCLRLNHHCRRSERCSGGSVSTNTCPPGARRQPTRRRSATGSPPMPMLPSSMRAQFHCAPLGMGSKTEWRTTGR